MTFNQGCPAKSDSRTAPRDEQLCHSHIKGYVKMDWANGRADAPH